MSNIPKKNGNLLQCHLAFLQKAKERRRWSVASIPSSGYGTTTPASSNSQCSLNTDDHLSCSCLHGGNHNSNHSQTQPYTTISASPKLYHSNIAGTLAQHYSSNDSNPSLNDGDGRLLSTLPYFRPRSRSLSSPIRSPALDQSKSTLNSATSKENLTHTPIVPGTLTFRRRSRSLSSPIRSPNVENRFVQMNYVYKERFPNAINQMNEKLEKFIVDNPELIPEVASDAVTRFVHHQVIELAKDCLQKSKDELLTSHYFHEMSDSLDRLVTDCQEKSQTATQHLRKLIKQLLIIVSRSARLLECLEFNPDEFYQFLEAAEGQAKTVLGVKANLPQYIISKLGLTKDPLTEFNQLNEQLAEKLDQEDSKDGKSEHDQLTAESSVKPPSEKDYETIKLISNGAYGAVYLVRHKETNQRYAMKKISKQNLVLRNQIEQAFAERDIMCFTDNPFVVSLFCSFETKNHLCMVMEYVEGGDCATLLKNMGPLPVDLAKFYFAETVLAVEYLHELGVVHRDLKPDNLLITALGHVKISDFGLSKIGLMNLTTNLHESFIDRETKQFNDNQVCGTAEYIAPEVILRQGYGKPVDWWSMGIILYEFLIGMVPWSGDSTAEELFSHVINDEIEWPSDDDWPLPEEAKLIITQLLMPNPVDRLGTQGANEVKEHPFFAGLDWDALLRQKAEFVPQLNDEYDTSYFDTRLDRYNHELEDSEGLNDSDDSPLFSSFSSCSPRYHRIYSKLGNDLDDDKPTKSSSTLSISVMDDSSRKSSAEEKEISKSLIKSSLSVEEPPAAKREIKCKKDLNEELLSKLTGNEELSGKYLAAGFTPDSSQTESEDYSPLMQRRRKTMDSNKEMPKFNIEMPVKEELESTAATNEKRPLTPSIKETPPDDSNNEEVESNSNEDNTSLVYDENRLSLSSGKARPVIKSASASGLSQLLPEPPKIQQRRYTQPEHRQQLDESGGMFSDHSTTSSIHDQADIIKSCLNKSLLSRIDSPSKSHLSSRNSLNVRKSSLRQMSSPYGSSASSRDNSPNHDLIHKRKGSIESHNYDKRKSAADISLSGSFNNLSKLKPPVILRRNAKSTRGYGFSFKAIRVYYADSDVYTIHHLVMNVEPNSPAFEAGLKAGDLITHINSEPLQGLLHHQVLRLVLSRNEIEIRTTPLEATSIKTGGRRRNPQQIKLARRGLNRHHSHRKSSCLLSANEQLPTAIPSLSPAVLKRTDSDKRRKNSSLFRRLSSKRASADMQQFLTTSSCLTDTTGQLPSNITPSKSFQHLSPNSKDPNDAKPDQSADSPGCCKTAAASLMTTPPSYNRTTSHLLHQCSISDSSQSSSPNSSVPNSPATLTVTGGLTGCANCASCSNASTPLPANSKAQSISAAASFNRPNTLHGLKYKLVQTFRSPRRKSCGSITIPLSPLARNERTNSPLCAGCGQPNCINNQQQQPNLMSVSPTRSPSPLAFASNNGQPPLMSNRHAHHFHRHRHSQFGTGSGSSSFKASLGQPSASSSSSCPNNCPGNCSPNCCLNASGKQFASAFETEAHPLSSLSIKKSVCSSLSRPCCHSNATDHLDLDKSFDSKIAHRSKSAEPEACIPIARRRVSCACDHQYDQIYDNQFFTNRHSCCFSKGGNLKLKKQCNNCFTLSPLANASSPSTSKQSESGQSSQTSSSAELSKPEDCERASIGEHRGSSDRDDASGEQDSQDSQEQDCIAKDSESSCSSASNCSVLNMNEKLNEAIETIPEETGSPSKKPDSPSGQRQASSPSQESTFSKVKKSINSPIIIRKTLFKQNSEKRKGSAKASKDSKESKDSKDSKEPKDSNTSKDSKEAKEPRSSRYD